MKATLTNLGKILAYGGGGLFTLIIVGLIGFAYVSCGPITGSPIAAERVACAAPYLGQWTMLLLFSYAACTVATVLGVALYVLGHIVGGLLEFIGKK